MIQVNWMATTLVVALGALLTALLTYVAATVGRSADHRTGTGASYDGARSRDLDRQAAAKRRPAA
jgi:hypothetical protein